MHACCFHSRLISWASSGLTCLAITMPWSGPRKRYSRCLSYALTDSTRGGRVSLPQTLVTSLTYQTYSARADLEFYSSLLTCHDTSECPLGRSCSYLPQPAPLNAISAKRMLQSLPKISQQAAVSDLFPDLESRRRHRSQHIFQLHPGFLPQHRIYLLRCPGWQSHCKLQYRSRLPGRAISRPH